MNSLLINTYDYGGAATACLRLHKGLLDNGVNSKVLVKNKTKNDIPELHAISPTAIERTLNEKISSRARNIFKEFNIDLRNKDEKIDFIAGRDSKLEMFSFPDSIFNITKSKYYKQAELINLHWVADFLNYSSFYKQNDKPVIWTLHDMNPFSGGEHFEEIYLGMNDKGYPLKRNLTQKEKEISTINKEIKIQALENVNNLHIVSLCKWMKDLVDENSIISRFPSYLIPNGIDSKIFKIHDKNFSRDVFNIPRDKIVLLFISTSLQNERKGLTYLYRSFEFLQNPDLLIISAGNKGENLTKNGNIWELGKIYDEQLMSILYSAADVFVIPSLMDNLPNTAIEAILCGTPVIGFPVGGLNDIIQNEQNGILSDEISVNSLTQSINEFIRNKDHFNSEEIRIQAVNKYDISVQAKAYIELYCKILKI